MARIAFSTCEENDTSNQVLRIMFFDVWAVTRWFSFSWQHFTFLKKSFASVEAYKHERGKVCWSRYFSRGLRGKSWKQECERENETRCEIAGKIFLRNEKDDEREVQDIEPAELSKHLAEFICSVRRKDGEDYEPSSLRCLVSSIERHLKKNNYTKSIINDKEF